LKFRMVSMVASEGRHSPSLSSYQWDIAALA
jgi:hypothetical protein